MKLKNYADVNHKDLWMRHPTLGDPSFDTFEKHGSTVHISTPPYEWGVNGSLFRDPKTGYWYCYAGIYLQGYATTPGMRSHFIMYESKDEGKNWINHGSGFEPGFTFENSAVSADSHPDVVVEYDDTTDTYWMAYDFSTDNFTWEHAHSQIPPEVDMDSGAALAWAKHPLGPFTRLPQPCYSNKKYYGLLGKYDRGYATTLLKRANDWILLILFDSHQHFSWAYACMTAPQPEGPWSAPHLVISPENGRYYPGPIEFHPAFTYEGRVYAPATSVSRNRNYQAVFSADLEQAHLPQAWGAEWEGNWWHSRPSEEEYAGIWGQANHGFVHDNTLYVMAPSKNSEDRGVIQIASRPWDTPFSDGFTLSGHGGPSIAPLYQGYLDFLLNSTVDFTGTMEILFDYDGLLGPDIQSSDAACDALCFTDCYSLQLQQSGAYSLLRYDSQGQEVSLLSGIVTAPITAVTLEVCRDSAAVSLNGEAVGKAVISIHKARPLALATSTYSVLNVSDFSITGEPLPYHLHLSAREAVLQGGENRGVWKEIKDNRYKEHIGYETNQPDRRAKWNFIGRGFTLYAPTDPSYGIAELWLDGYFLQTLSFSSTTPQPSVPLVTFDGLSDGKHSLEIRSRTGTTVLDVLEFWGG